MIRMPLNTLIVSVFLASSSLGTAAQEAQSPSDSAESPAAIEILPAEQVELDSYLWANRVLVVFSDTPADPRYIKQMQMIEERPRDLLEREVVVVSDTAPKPPSDVRAKLRPRGFALVLVDKDGGVKLRKPTPWSTREIARSIDKTPLRIQEIRERAGSASQ